MKPLVLGLKTLLFIVFLLLALLLLRGPYMIRKIFYIFQKYQLKKMGKMIANMCMMQYLFFRRGTIDQVPDSRHIDLELLVLQKLFTYQNLQDFMGKSAKVKMVW